MHAGGELLGRWGGGGGDAKNGLGVGVAGVGNIGAVVLEILIGRGFLL